MVSRLKNENVVELLGYCLDGGLRVLAYEFASNGSLHDILHGNSLDFHSYSSWQLTDCRKLNFEKLIC